MSDMPKSIWATGTDLSGSWNVKPTGTKLKTPLREVEYIRADIYRAEMQEPWTREMQLIGESLEDAKRIKELEVRIDELEVVVKKLWRRQDSLDTFDAAVNDILSPLFEEQPHE